MSQWKKTKLGEVIFIKKGDYITKKTAKPGKYPVILGGQEPAYYINKYNHTGKAIVVSRSGASAGFVSKWDQPIFITDGFLIEPSNKITFDFLYYSMKYRQAFLHHIQRGAAIPHVTPSLISDIEINLPDLDDQYKIADTLYSYDSLIENYQRQIKLLEEAAQRLYKEWFVDLHFPGYENTKIVDGVPEGWEKTVLSKIAEFRRGKTVVKKEITVGSIPVVAGGLTPAYYFNKANTENRVITISGSGANAGFTKLYYQRVWASDCSFVDTSMTEHLYFVYCFMKANKINIDNLQKGAAQPHVYAKDINNLQIIIPDHNILSQFEAKAANAFERIAILKSQLRLLTEARDRLLPKLMSGEIEV